MFAFAWLCDNTFYLTDTETHHQQYKPSVIIAMVNDWIKKIELAEK